MYARRTWAHAAVLGALAASQPQSAQALPDHTSFDLVLGQTRLGTNRPNAPDGTGVFQPLDVALDHVHAPTHVYLADPGNGRVLGWRDLVRFRAGAAPDLILGQPDAYGVQRLHSGNRDLSNPSALAVDKDGTLWVADNNNGRVVGYLWPFNPAAPKVSGAPVDILVGQPEFDLGYYLTACNGGSLFGTNLDSTRGFLCSPQGVATDAAGNLYISDTTNSRVLGYRAPVAARGATPTLLIGQASFAGVPVASACNRGAGVAAANSLCRPLKISVAPSGSQLLVSDLGNSRVLAFDDPWNNGSAQRVFGQADLTRNDGGNTSLARLYNPSGVLMDRSGVVWVADASHARVVGYAPPFAGVGGFSMTYVLGQPDLATSLPNGSTTGGFFQHPGPQTMVSSSGLAMTGAGSLIALDNGNHRAVIYDNPTQIYAPGDAVFGQKGLSGYGQANRTRAYGLSMPAGVALDRPDPATRPGEPIHVYVADFGNNRVLGWRDLFALRSGQPADVVLGQADMESGTCNRNGPASAVTLCWPRAVAVDRRGDVWVADSWNHRVVRFPRPFEAGLQAANLVLGQAGFTGAQPNRTGAVTPDASGLWNPSGLAVDDGGVWVADRDNGRVLYYAAPISQGAAAARVLLGKVAGAPVSARSAAVIDREARSAAVIDREARSAAVIDREARSAAVIDPMTLSGCPTAANGAYVCGPSGLSLNADGNLWVAERDNHRVALYSTTVLPGTQVLPPTPLAVLGQPDAVTALSNHGGTAPSADSLRLPEGVAVEIGSGALGPVDVAVVVADTDNNRLAIYGPVKSGFQRSADQVLGQNGSATTRDVNGAPVTNDDPAVVGKNLWTPSAVVATAEGLLIAESGGAPGASSKGQLGPPNLFRYAGNNRVLLIKGPAFPLPPPPDLSEVPDLSEAPDLSQDAPDAGVSADDGGPDLASRASVAGGGFGCSAGRGGGLGANASAGAGAGTSAGTGVGLGAGLGLLLAGVLWRRRRRLAADR